MTYKNVKITKRDSGKYSLKSPVNGTLRIFNDLKTAKYYIDNCKALDSHAAAMRQRRITEMTREQKIEWLAKATNEEVLNQMKWAVIAMTKADSIATQIEGQEDYELVAAEIKRRMAK